MIKIVVDSTADVPPDLRESYGISVVPIMIQFGQETLRDGLDVSKDQFYARLIQSVELPKTSAPSIGMFEEVFRELSADGSTVLSLSLASELSGTFAAAQQAAQLLEGARIVCFDSRTVAMPLTYLAIAAARAAQAGQSLDQIVAMLETLRSGAVLYVGLDTLHYLEKGGRIGRMRALLGTMLNVKPILQVRDGQVLPVEQLRTWKRALPRMIELVQAQAPFEEFCILYTTTRDRAEQLADLSAAAGIMERARIRVEQAGAALGTHVGPGTLGVAGLRRPDRV